jgi:ubiquinone/menaquinone biosynthesis C-methylase UbiE
MNEAIVDKAIVLGHPSYVWRYGQDRRLNLMCCYVPLEQKRILDVGCGLGMYVKKFRAFSDEVFGVDVDAEKVENASQSLPNISVAPAEQLPFLDYWFDVVLLHEVIEHVADDRAAISEAYRVTRPGGSIIIFAPNRLYPFETHGFYLGKKYIFKLLPVVNYLPDRVRRVFVPHVRIYRTRDLRRLFEGLAVKTIVHTQIYPGFDNIASRHRRLATFLRRVLYTLEQTPLRSFGLSHFLVVRKL